MDLTADDQTTHVSDREDTAWTSVSNPRRIRL